MDDQRDDRLEDKKQDIKILEELLELSDQNLIKLANGFKYILASGNMYLIKDQAGFSGRFSEQGVNNIQLEEINLTQPQKINLVAATAFFVQMMSNSTSEKSFLQRFDMSEKYLNKVILLWSELNKLSAVSDFMYQANTLGNRVIGASIQIQPKLVPITPDNLKVYPTSDFSFTTSMGDQSSAYRFELPLIDIRIFIDRLKRAQTQLENLQKEVIDRPK